MKDSLGLYYFPKPADHSLRVYVRMGKSGAIEFRLWKEGMPEVWERHPWIPHDVLSMANDLYHKERNEKADNLSLYDLSLAKLLLSEEKGAEQS
ncbi:MAG: hypothetical protein IJU76_08680 [Desulfovibrionaceae bacterium]|nr:hypothetical protein [Desulfovibrionaceae bacterium]